MRLFGSDGKTHLDYDLIVQNVFNAPVTVTSIEVLDGDGTSLQTLDRDQVAAATGPIVFGVTPTKEVPAGAAMATVMDVILPTDEVPEKLTHRITYETGASPSTSILGGADILGPDLVLDPRSPLTIGPPLRGTGWLNASSCCAPESLHRNVRLAVGGTSIKNVQEFAIDWTQLRDGTTSVGDGHRNEDYHAYGADLLAVADGTVAAAVDGRPNQTPNTPAVGIGSPKDYPGNHVSLQLAPDVWAVYAHIQPGTVTVKPGEKVAKGQVIGKLGNSGNSGGPHLHFQLADGPELLNSSSLPFSLESYDLLGSVDPATVTDDDPEVKVTGPAGPQRDTYPLTYTVIDIAR
jgi:murein DD-endopeptidase MepM/ murein hydrolase activator NlpD